MKKLEEQIENNTGAVQAIDQLIELTPNLSMFEKFPGAGRFSVNRKLAEIRSMYKIQLGQDPNKKDKYGKELINISFVN